MIDGELIYNCKMIQPGIFSRFSQPDFLGCNLEILRYLTEVLFLNLEKCAGWLNLEKNQVGSFNRSRLIPQSNGWLGKNFHYWGPQQA